MTLKEIAAQANVSISTVSRVLNAACPCAASKEVQDRIWSIAQENGYIPNRAAQTLKKGGQSGPRPLRSIYCLVACSPEEVRDDPFFTQVISSVERESFQCGYVLEYTFYAGESDEGSTMQLMRSAPGGQLIIIGRFQPHLYEELSSRFKSIVYLGWNTLNVPCDGVICDGYLAAQEAVRYLHSLGHRQIGFIGIEQEARYHGYLKALEELGLSRESRNIATGPWLSYEWGRHGMECLLKQGMTATAVYCANDTTAIGVLRACAERGIRVPEELSVMGTNDIETVQYVSPMLTTIHIPLAEMGKVATHTLIDRIQGGHALPLRVTLPFHIVRRESCAAPGAKPPAQDL